MEASSRRPWQRTRVADISVVPSLGARDDVFRDAIRDAALFQLGPPVLVVPEEVSSQFGKTVVVAWKDSVEAVRAVMAAAAFFARASFSQSPRANRTTRLWARADYLTLTGLKVEAVRIVSRFDTIAKTLLHEAASVEPY
jgi:hypothetical protein